MMNLKARLSPLSLVILLFILSFNLTGCKTIDVKGQFVSNEDIEKINEKKPTKEELAHFIGTPTYVPEYTDNTWYYLQRSLARRAWLNPQISDQRVLKIVFDRNGRVKEATLFEDEQNERISVNKQYTDTLGTKQSSTQKFVKNIGRFNKANNPTVKRGKKK